MWKGSDSESDSGPAGASHGMSDEELCEYERKRLENIKQNEEVLKSLGLPVRAQKVSTKKGKKRRRRRDRDSSDEDEWQPWMEEQPARKTKGRAVSVGVSSKRHNLSSASVETKMNHRFTNVLRPKETSNTDLKVKMQKWEPNSTPPSTQKQGLPELFHDSVNDSPFFGFTAEEIADGPCFDVTRLNHFEQLFGEIEEDGGGEGQCEKEEEFMGFTQDDLAQSDIPSDSVPRSSVRVKGKRCYEEEEESDDDEYLFCEDCNTLHHGDCPIHGPLSIFDESLGCDEDSKLYTSLPIPAQLTVKPSRIPNAGNGVFARQFIPKGVRMGPYQGVVVPKNDMDQIGDTSYMWEIKRVGQKAFFVDGSDERTSNWLRFVNCARNEDEQNMVAFQYKGNIYYRNFKHVYPGNELLVWYGEEYARDLGIDVTFGDFDQEFQCKNCGSTFVEQRSFQLHLRSNAQCAKANPQLFKCGKCLQTFSELYQLQHHIRRHEDIENEHPKHGENFNENVPPHDLAKFNSRTTFRHLQEHTHTGDKPYKCEYCGKTFSQRSHLQTHIRTHTGDKPYKSEYCGKTFSDNGHLQRHIRTHTGDKPYKCEYCGKTFSQNGHLQRHIRTHTGDKPYKCEYCEKTFSRSGSLQGHIRTHTGDKPYKCEYCGKTFSRSGHLQRHIRTHTGDKPYKCEYCGKTFRNSGDLQRHIRTHTGDKPYKCEYCGKTFSQGSSLQTHIRTHTGDKPYKCEYCGKAFSRSGALQSHIQLAHETM